MKTRALFGVLHALTATAPRRKTDLHGTITFSKPDHQTPAAISGEYKHQPLWRTIMRSVRASAADGINEIPIALRANPCLSLVPATKPTLIRPPAIGQSSRSKGEPSLKPRNKPIRNERRILTSRTVLLYHRDRQRHLARCNTVCSTGTSVSRSLQIYSRLWIPCNHS